MCRLLFLLLYCCVASGLMGQGIPDTILVNASTTVSLVFPGAIEIVDIGSQDFIHQKKGEVLLLKSKSSARPTSLFVKYGSQGRAAYLNKTLAFGKGRSFYQIIKAESGPQSPALDSLEVGAAEEEEPVYFPEETYTTGLRSMQSTPRQVFSIGDLQGKYAVYLHSIRADEKAIYLRIALQNKGRAAFKLGNVLVEHSGVQLSNRLLNSRKQKVELLDMDMPAEVGKKSTEYIYLAISEEILSNSDKNSYLVVKVRSKSGRGEFQIYIPGKFFINPKDV